MDIKTYLPIIQIAISVILIVLILLQQRSQALGSAFGQEGGFYATRRGLQQKILWATVALGIAFVVLALLNLVL